MGEIEAVKQRADIVDVIGRVAPLVRSGRTYKACCPFHQEKTPSFVVNPERQTWHCFGACGTGGDVFQFLMRRDNLTFGEALRQLAGEVGVELKGGGEDRRPSARLYEANEAAVAYFAEVLAGDPRAEAARAYVERRGVDAPTGAAFELGYALNSYEALLAHLGGRGFSTEKLVEAGLLSEGEHGTYDRFRDRLIFPIRDERGKCIGFGGRVIGEGRPKYLNSPQGPLFDKSATLYALDRAHEAIRAAGYAVVVEGYMDVIAAHQFGLTNVVATLGTALTERHVGLLKRYTKRVTLAMDADAAGAEAMARGLGVVRRLVDAGPAGEVEAVVGAAGMVRLQAVAPVEITVFTVPHGKDPDEAIRADPAAFMRLAEEAVPPFDFLLRHELAKVDRRDGRAMLELADRLLPVIAGVPNPVLRSQYLSQVATTIGAREDDLRARLAEQTPAAERPRPLPLRERAEPVRPAVSGDESPTAPTPSPGRPVAEVGKAERLCLRLLYEYPTLRTDGMLVEEELFTDAANRTLFQVWRGSPDLDGIAALLEPAMAAYLVGVLDERMPPFDETKAARALADLLGRIRLRRMEEQKRLLAAAVHETEAEVSAGRAAAAAHRFFAAESGADSEDAETARQAMADLEAGMRLHEEEAALRLGRR